MALQLKLHNVGWRGIGILDEGLTWVEVDEDGRRYQDQDQGQGDEGRRETSSIGQQTEAHPGWQSGKQSGQTHQAPGEFGEGQEGHVLPKRSRGREHHEDAQN